MTGLPDLTLYGALVDDGVLALRDGSFVAAWQFRGPDMAARTADEMAGLSRQINRVLMQGSGWMVQCDACRSYAQDYPAEGNPPDEVTAAIDHERREQFVGEGIHYESEYYFCVTYQPPAASEERVKGWMFTSGESDDGLAGRALRDFANKCASIEDGLRSSFDYVQRLGYDEETGFDGLLAYVHRCVTGIDQPVMRPEFPVGLQDLVACADFVGGNEPMIDGKHLRVIAIDGFPLHSVPGILHALDALAIEYRWNTRALLLDAEDAKVHIERAGKDWFFKIQKMAKNMGNTAPNANGAPGTINMDAAQMYADAMGAPATPNSPAELGAYGEASSNLVQFAWYTAKIVLIDSDRLRMRDSISEVQRIIKKHGFGARIETVNAVEAYLGSLPGDGHRDLRRSMLHTMNLADMLPVTSVWTGAKECPSPIMRRQGNAAPLLLASTTGATPLRFHVHVGDVGHVFAVGPSGSGKSTCLALMAAQWRARYRNAQVFVFDKDHSMYALTMACGGEFYDPAKMAASGFALQPLAHLETASDIAWACEYVETLCVLQKIKVFGPKERRLLADGIELLRTAERRGMTELVTNIMDEEVQEALMPYTEGHELGSLVDGRQEHIKDGKFVTFELSGLMNLGERAVSAVLPYLFRRISRQLEHGSGEPTLIILDEAWLWLKNERFRDQIAEWLMVMRKQNAAVILATPGLNEIFTSPIGPTILEACKTKLLFPNKEATNPETIKLYKKLGLGDGECALIADAKEKEDVYVVSHDGRRMINVQVGPVGLSFCGANSKDERSSIEALIKGFGAAWPAEWLRTRGLEEQAEHMADWALHNTLREVAHA